MEYTLPSPAGMQLVASGSRPLCAGLRDSLRAVWGSVREGSLDDGALLPAAVRSEIERLHAFHFRGALWILHGDVLEQVDHRVLAAVVGPFAAKLKTILEEDGHFYQLIRQVLVANHTWMMRGGREGLLRHLREPAGSTPR